MSKLYSIQESTLTDIGDALRSKYGESYIEIERTPATIIKSSKATGFNTYGGYTGFDIAQVFKCPGASYIKLVYTTNVNNDSYYIKYAIGEFTRDTFPTDGIVLENVTEPNTITIETDVISIRAYDYSWSNRGYYIQATGYDAANNPIELEGSTIIEKEIEVPNTYSSAEVASLIRELPSKPGPIVLTGTCNYVCSGPVASSYLEHFGDTITTKELGNTQSMFANNSVRYIPFELNYTTTSTTDLSSLFYMCQSLRSLPKINNPKPTNISTMFRYCMRLREIPDDYFDTCNLNTSYFALSTSQYSGSNANVFENCYSLRKMPLSWLKYMNPYVHYSYSYYYHGFTNCYVLDELLNLPVPYIKATWTSNAFVNTFTNCYRLKNIAFETNEDGTPIVVQWKSQTIDLTRYVGYAQFLGYITDYDSGIPDAPPKEVWSDTYYNQLKDDPDWYTKDIQYSRYNRTSAVETINSLPDTSAYLATAGGTNTIKFKGASGSATDGGAINTMTEEEIAVAAAKGWTVSFT